MDVALFAPAVRDPGQDVGRDLGAHAAGHALAARLALGHRHVGAGHVHQVNTFTAALAARLGKEQEAIPAHQGPDGVARLILAELLDLGQQGRAAVCRINDFAFPNPENQLVQRSLPPHGLILRREI